MNATVQSVLDETEESIDFVENIQYDNNRVRVVYLRKFEEPSGPPIPQNSSLRVVNLKRAIPATTTPAEVEDPDVADPKGENLKPKPKPLELQDIIPAVNHQSPITKKPFVKITTSAEIKKQQQQLFEVYYDDYYDSEELNEYVGDDGIESDDIPTTEVCSTEECDTEEELIEDSDEFLPFGVSEPITKVPVLLAPERSPPFSLKNAPTDNQRNTKNAKITPFKVPPIKPKLGQPAPVQPSSSNETPISTASSSTSSSSSSSSSTSTPSPPTSKPSSSKPTLTTSPVRAKAGDSRIIPFKAPPIKKQPITYFALPPSASTSSSSISPSKSPNPTTDIKLASPKIIRFKAPPIKPITQKNSGASNEPSAASTASPPLAVVDTLDTFWNFISNIFTTNPNNTESGIPNRKQVLPKEYNPIPAEAVTPGNVDTASEVSPKDDIWDSDEEYPSGKEEEEFTENEIDTALNCFNLFNYILNLRAPDMPDFMKEPGFNPQQVEYMKFTFFRLIENFMFIFA